MRIIELKPTEFYQFKVLANQISLWFTYKLFMGVYSVTADDTLLESLGY